MASLLKNKKTVSKVGAAIPKRALIASVQAAGKKTQVSAMEIMGYVIVVRGNDIIKKYSDGRIEIIGQVTA